MRLEHKRDDSSLFIYLPSRIDSTNASEVEEAIYSILGELNGGSLILSAKETVYISSVGLRLILKLSKTYPYIRIIDCSSDVYSIFEMTGFILMIDISKALREISIEGCPLIGKGAYGKVYRIRDDMILKSFYKGNPISDIERERSLAREAFILGIPTAISFDVVKVKEECYGAVYEMIASDSLIDCFKKYPNEYEHYLSLYVNLLKKMGNTRTNNEKFPKVKDDLSLRLDTVKPVIDAELYLKIKDLVDSIEDDDVLIHGDCHFKNIFSSPDGLMLIDMDTLSRGNPLIEIANLHRTYVGFEEVDPGNMERFFEISPSFTKKLYEDIFKGLYPEGDEGLKRKIEKISYFLLLSHYAKDIKKNESKFNNSIRRLEELFD